MAFKDEWLIHRVTGLLGVTKGQIEAFRFQRHEYLANALVVGGLVTEGALLAAVSKAEHVGSFDSADGEIDKLVISLVPERICQRYGLIPLRLQDESIAVAMANPLDLDALEDLQAVSGRVPIPLYCLPRQITALISEHYDPDALVYDLLTKLDTTVKVEVLGVAHREKMVDEIVRMPIIKLVDALVCQAVKMRASDIHLEHEEHATALRFRIDGNLRNILSLPHGATVDSVVSRIKIMANLNISEHRRPQDGRARLRVGAVEYGLRVSTLPTTYGETVVLRILDPNSSNVSLDKLGIMPDIVGRLEVILKSAQGIILFTGPTGAGKTTTLCSILNNLKATDTNIVTVEDPIEYRLEGVNQVQVEEKAGLSFSSVLRSVLRQDPDIIMVGEIRDSETADIAFQAALTGHFVLTTLHTNDTTSSITRLVDMGVKRFKIAPGLRAITAQRLVRRLCAACKEPVPQANADPRVLAALWEHDLEPRYFRPKGCAACDSTGYAGRMLILEYLEVDEELRKRITAGDEETPLRLFALKSGALHTLMKDALWHLSRGDTSFAEILPHCPMDSSGPAQTMSATASPSSGRVPSPADIGRESAAAVQAAPAALPGAGHRILIADDDGPTREFLRSLLEGHGLRVEEAKDGVDALAQIAKSPPDLLIVDLNMPRLDGYGVIRALRKDPRLRLPIIMLTCNDNEKSQEEAINLGADDYIIKPFKHPLLLARINAVFRRLER
jgi:type IV pilus assembly protein PilB